MLSGRRIRVVVLALCAVLLAGAFSGLAEKSPPAPTHFRLVPAAEGVYAAIAKEGDPAALGNSGFVVGSSGVLVVDSFAQPAAAEELLAQIRKLTRAPVRWLVNTHYHLDHVGGNGVFARGGASVLAHENVRVWIRTENLKFVPEEEPGQKARVEALVLPDVTYRQALSVWLGNRRVEIFSRPGHTGGDSVVSVPDASLLFTGDLFWKSEVPNCVDADTRAWSETLDSFLADFPTTTFVPGHGDVGKALDVRFFRDYVLGLHQTVEQAVAQGSSGTALVGTLLPLHRRRFGSWTGFDSFAEKNIESTEQEIRGTKRFPPPLRP